METQSRIVRMIRVSDEIMAYPEALPCVHLWCHAGGKSSTDVADPVLSVHHGNGIRVFGVRGLAAKCELRVRCVTQLAVCLAML